MRRTAPMLMRRLAAAQLGGVGVFALASAQSASNERTADARAEATMADMYGGLPDIHDISGDEQRVIDHSGGHQAYGELTMRGARAVQALLLPQQNDVFYDLGSGAGRLVVQAALEWPCHRAVGLELAQSRHRVGELALSRAAPHVRQRVSLRCEDMIACARCEDATLVYVASLLFDDAFMSQLGERLSELPRLRAIASLRRFPPDSLPGFVEDERNFASGTDAATLRDRVEVTWGAARVFLYWRER